MSIFDIFKGKKKQQATRSGNRKRFQAADSHYSLGNWVSTDYDTINSKLFHSLDIMRARSRQAERDNPIAHRYLKLAERNIVGDGFVLRPKTGNMNLDKAVLRALDMQSKRENFTPQGVWTRAQFEAFVVRSLLRDGEFFARKVRDGMGGFKIRPIDPAQVFTQFTGSYTAAGGYVVNAAMRKNLDTNNRVILGVEVNDEYKPVAYYFYTARPTYNSGVIYNYAGGEIERVEADEMIHLYMPEYANQVRGIPHFHAVLKELESKLRYDEAFQDACRKGAGIAVTLKSPTGTGIGGEKNANNADMTFDLSGEEIIQLKDGEEFNLHDLKYPSNEYASYTDKANERIAAGMDITQPSLTNNWAGINFSAGQLMYYDDRDNWKRWQKFISDNFHAWWYKDWLMNAALQMKLKNENGSPISMKFYKTLMDKEPQWLGKYFPQVDQQKFTNANKALLEMGVKSRADIIREMGGDPEEVFAEIEAENERFGAPMPEPKEEMPADEDKPDEPNEDEGEEMEDKDGK